MQFNQVIFFAIVMLFGAFFWVVPICSQDHSAAETTGGKAKSKVEQQPLVQDLFHAFSQGDVGILNKYLPTAKDLRRQIDWSRMTSGPVPLPIRAIPFQRGEGPRTIGSLVEEMDDELSKDFRDNRSEILAKGFDFKRASLLQIEVRGIIWGEAVTFIPQDWSEGILTLTLGDGKRQNRIAIRFFREHFADKIMIDSFILLDCLNSEDRALLEKFAKKGHGSSKDGQVGKALEIILRNKMRKTEIGLWLPGRESRDDENVWVYPWLDDGGKTEIYFDDKGIVSRIVSAEREVTVGVRP